MAESGILLNHEWLKKIASINLIQTPATLVRREVYEKLGGFDFRLAGTEDWEMWVRIAAQLPMWYEVTPFSSLSSSFSITQSKRNSKRFDAPWVAYIKQSTRHYIETVFSGITCHFPKSLHAVTMDGFLLMVAE